MKISRKIICSFTFVLFLVTVTGISRADDANMSFISHIGGSITDVDVVGNYAYVGEGQDFVVLDITDSSNPRKVGKLSTPMFINDITVSGNYAYVVGGTGLSIIDISDPSLPKKIGSYSFTATAANIAVSGNYIYVTHNAWYSSGFYVIDVSNPSMPVLVSDLPRSVLGASEIEISGNYAYVVEGTGLSIIDISNPSSPKVVSFYSGRFFRVTVSGNYAYVTDSNNYGFVIFDVSDVTSPKVVGRYDSPDGCAYKIALSGNYAYITNANSGDNGLTVLDVTNVSSPKLLGKCNTGSVTGIALSGNHAYVVTGTGGLAIVDITDTSSPKLSGSYNTINSARDVFVLGNYAYVADEGNGLVTVDITNTSSPKFVGKYHNGGTTYSVAVSGNYAYLAGGDSNLVIVDISNPSSPRLASNCYTSFSFYSTDIALAKNCAFIAYNGGLAIVDIADPLLPKLIGSYKVGDIVNGVAVEGNYAYAALRDGGFIILDITDPAVPTLVGKYSDPGSASGIVVSGNHVYLANGGLSIVDVSDRSSPTLVAKLAVPAQGIDVSGNLAYVSTLFGGLYVVDISNATSPTIVAHYATVGVEFNSCTKDDYVYVADGGNGLVILKTDIQNQEITVGQGASTPEITQKFIEACDRNGGLSVIGNPTTEVHSAFGFEVQDFPEIPATDGGVIMYNPNNNTAYFIHGAIWDKYYAYPDADKAKLGCVARDEEAAAVQSGRTTGRYTKFETGTIHWISNKDNENVGHPKRGESFVTYGDLDKLHTDMKGTFSDLGFPIMDQKADGKGHDYCEFEGGNISWDALTGAYKAYLPTTTTPPVGDNEPPQIQLWGAPADSSTVYVSPVLISGTVTDPSGVKSIFVNGKDVTPPFIGSTSVSFSDYVYLNEGQNEITITATDNSEKHNSGINKIHINYLSLKIITTTFKPDHNGYSFDNYAGKGYSKDEFYNTYGAVNSINWYFPKNVYFYDHYFKNNGGYCFGISASSLVLYNHEVVDTYIYEEKATTPSVWREFGPFVNGYFPPTIIDWVRFYQPLQYDKAILEDKSTYKGLPNVYNELKLRMSSSDWAQNPMALGFSFDVNGKKYGHAVVPYKIEESLNYNVGTVSIYDPNKHGDSSQNLTIDLVNWAVSDYGTWKNLRDFQLVALKAINAKPEIPTSLAIVENEFSYLLYTDSSGRQLGYDQGEFKDEIPGTCPVIFYGQETNASSSPEAYYVPDPSIKMELRGVGNGDSEVSIITPNGLIVANVPVSPSSVDELKILNNGTGIEFNSENGITPSLSLMLDVETPNFAQTVRSNMSQIEATGAVSLSNVNGAISIQNHGLPRTCSLHLEQMGSSPNSDDSIKNIVIEGNSIVYIKPSNWNDIANSEVTIEHDVGSDGTIDSTEIVRSKDTMPPSTVLNLQSTNSTTWINWTWTNPSDPDFNHTEIYLNGIFQTNTSAVYFNTTGLQPETSYTLGTRTVDNNGNVNETWVNSTATTSKKFVPTIPVITWGNPADIIYGTALSDAQLNAVSSVAGTFIYTPAAGKVLSAGNQQNLHVELTPDDTANYDPTSMDVKINVLTPVQKIQQIITMVQSLNLNKGQANSLIVKLNAATKNMNSGNTKAATNELNAFNNEVGANIKSGKLSSTQGQALIDAANSVVNALKTS